MVEYILFAGNLMTRGSQNQGAMHYRTTDVPVTQEDESNENQERKEGAKSK
jgi:hypothetical protein